MILDQQLLLSESQDLTGVAGTTVSTNTIDLAAAGRDIGSGAEIKVHIRALEDFAGGTSVDFQLIEDNDPALGSPNILKTTGAVATGSILEGTIYTMVIPAKRVTLQYLGVQYVTLGTHTGSNTVDAGVVMDEQTSDSDWTAVTGY